MFDSVFPSPGDHPLPPTPIWYEQLAMAIGIFSISSTSPLIRLSAGPILLALLFHITFWTQAPTYNEYTVGTECMVAFFAWVDFVACHVPERDFWKTGVDAQGRVVEGRAPKTMWAKLKWSTEFWYSYRKIGWNIQVSSIPPAVPRDYPRGRFLRDLLFQIFKIYAGLDTSCYILRIMGHSRRSVLIFDEPLSIQLLSGWATACRAYFGMSLVYQIFAFIAVLLHLTPPSSWPPVNGSFHENFVSVRKVWGKLWHQFIRRYTTSVGLAATRTLGFRKGTFASRYTQLWVAFVVTALMHAPPAVGWQDCGFWQALAFLSQPAAVMFEDLAAWAGRKTGVKTSAFTKTLGYLWVFLWFSFILRFWVATVPIQYTIGDELPSLLGYLVWISGAQTLRDRE